MKLQYNPESVHRLKPEYALQIWQILHQLSKSKSNHRVLMDAIGDVESNNGEVIDFGHLVDELREVIIDFMEECGSCGCYHRPDYDGDCRNNLERF